MRYFALLLIIGVVFSMLAGPQPIRPGVGDLPSNYRPDPRWENTYINSTATGTRSRPVFPNNSCDRIPGTAGIGRGEIVTAPTHQVSSTVESAR